MKIFIKKYLFGFYCTLLLVVFEKAQSQPGAEPPVVNYISVINAEGDIYVSWSPSPTSGVYGYVISEYIGDIGGAYQAHEIITIPDTTNWILQGIDPESTISLFVKVEDGQQYSTYHTKIYLAVDHEECRMSDTLNWTRYVGWKTNPILYRVWVNNTVVAEISDTGYIITNLDQDQQYSYKIEAVKVGDTISSFSNWVQVNTLMAKAPGYINADYATVVDNSYVSLSFSPDTSSEILNYALYRSGDKDNGFTQIQTIQVQQGDNKILLEDQTADITRVNYYLLGAINICNNIAEESNKSSNIVLRATLENMTINLDWNEYYDWIGGVDHYIVNKKSSNSPDWEQIQVTNNSYIDNLPEFSGSDMFIADVCYYIEAFEGTGNPYGSYSSASNQVCVQIVDLPNAFSPNGDGMNDYFPPELEMDYTDYKFIVYDKWGMKIYETDNPSNRWDGKGANSKYVPEGVYSYYLEITPVDGNKIKVQNQLTVVNP